MVLRGAFSQIGIGLALGIPAAIGAGKLMTNQLFGVKPWNPIDARAGGADARFGCTAGIGDPGAACCRRRANGGTAERVISRRASSRFVGQPKAIQKRASGRSPRSRLLDRVVVNLVWT